MFNITWILKIWENSCSYNVLDESIFNINMRITAIKSRILKALLFYFVCISLAIISYLNPSVFFSGETGILLILLLIGISFFFLGLGSIQRALKCQVEFQLDDINKMNQEQIQKIKTITSTDNSNKVDELTYASNTLDAFRKQRADLEQINTNIYDIRSVLRLIGMTILPFISSVFKTAIDDNIIVDALKTDIQSKINNIISLILK